jgi:predicted DCC family thiol-disulfide oxidoreductase YuxK
MNLSVLNSLSYTVGWFWSVFLGVNGHFILATTGAIFLILFQLYYTKIQDIFLYIQDALLVIFSIPLGIFLEMFFIQTNIIHYVNNAKIFPPLFVVCLYPLFSLLLNHSLKIIKKNYLLSFALGFFGAPLSYIAGASLGGLIFPQQLLKTWIFLGVGFGLFICLLSKIAHIIEKATKETLQDLDEENTLKLLYDRQCPICEKEICILRKKDKEAKINFVDISSKEFSPSDHNNIDYDKAMSQIHAIDHQGNILIGVPAFAALYARCNLLITSTLLRISFVKFALTPLYTLFAKNRLWITGRADTKSKK